VSKQASGVIVGMWLIRVALSRPFKGISIQIPMKVEAALRVSQAHFDSVRC
jgi:hypothetical protein